MEIIEPVDNVDGVDATLFIIVESKEEKKFKLSREASKLSGMIDDLLRDGDPDNLEVIPAGDVDAETLTYVVRYMEYHKNNRAAPIARPLRTKVSEDEGVQEWDKKFLYTDLIRGGDERDHDLLLRVMNAANYMNVNELLDLTCAGFASMVMGKTSEQIRELLHLPSEDEQHRQLAAAYPEKASRA